MTPAEFMREYETSGRVGGVEHTLRLIDDDAVYWFSDGTSHVGKDAIERAIRRNFDAIKDETYRIGDVVWVAQSPDVAACVYRFDWSGMIGGKPASGSGRGTSVLARRGDSWVVVHEHLSKGQAGRS
jgi:ketosteroid isomerase-like protein